MVKDCRYEGAWGFGAYPQEFDLGIPYDKGHVGRTVRIEYGLSSDRPAVAVLTLPERRGD